MVFKQLIVLSCITQKFTLVCDPAGPGFDYNNHKIPELPTLAAKNVQCIHTTNNYGTYNYNCHQNWRMGYCGFKSEHWHIQMEVMDFVTNTTAVHLKIISQKTTTTIVYQQSQKLNCQTTIPWDIWKKDESMKNSFFLNI